MSMEELMKTEDPDRNYRLVSYRNGHVLYSSSSTRPNCNAVRRATNCSGYPKRWTETAFAGLIVSPTETTTKPCVRHSNAGPKKEAKNNRITIRERMFSSKCRCETDRIRPVAYSRPAATFIILHFPCVLFSEGDWGQVACQAVMKYVITIRKNKTGLE